MSDYKILKSEDRRFTEGAITDRNGDVVWNIAKTGAIIRREMVIEQDGETFDFVFIVPERTIGKSTDIAIRTEIEKRGRKFGEIADVWE